MAADEIRHTATKTEIQGESFDADGNQAIPLKDPALVVVQGEPLGKVHRIAEGTTVIGRSPECKLQLSERSVSAHHARVMRKGSAIVVEDLRSTNGTTLNGEKLLRTVPLNSGDLIKIGKTVLKYTDDALEAQMVESLQQKGTLDPMTGVFNKGQILKQLAACIEVARQGYPLCLVMIDLDHFKKINDNFGHLAGDYVLVESCRLLRENILRAEDILGRYGGEEFVLIMPDTPMETAKNVAERIRSSLEQHEFKFDGKIIPVTASLGVTLWRPGLESTDALIDVADKLLYVAKKTGRNRVSV